MINIKTLKDHRLSKELLQKELASKAGICNSFYSLIEGGHKTPSMKISKKLADLLDLSLDEFFSLLNQSK